MAKNVFDNTLDVNNQVNVNSFDWTHTNHTTTEFGRITPVGVWDVPAKSSLRFNPELGFQLMPMLFPVQTPMLARLNFFKVEKRALNKDYMDMVCGLRQDLEEPYMSLERTAFNKTFGTSKLSDYLGLPSKVPQAQTTFIDANTSETDVNPSDLTIGKKIFIGIDTEIIKSYSQIYSKTGVVKGNSKCKFAYPDGNQGEKITIVLLKNVQGGWYIVEDILMYHYSGDTFEFKFNQDDTDRSVLIYFDRYKNSAPSAAVGTFSVFTNEQMVELDYNNTTFGADKSTIKISAYPFRAYEAIYNSYYRDSRNNPFILNGQPCYNKWIPNDCSGADKFCYELHYANWERDAFTTAVQNPQQGMKAPLAGITTYTQPVTLATGEVKHEVATALVLENGEKYALDYQTNKDGSALTGVSYTQLNGSENVRPVTNLAELANSGLSIETLRYVNAYQKYLELNMRKGYTYRDIMQGRWDIEIRFDELLMPTFLGGVTRELNMNAVTQTVDNASASDTSYESSLGSQSGIAGVYGNTQNNIEVFCDESSIVMAVLTIVPTPIYSQLTPKFFFYRDILDQPQPEFQNIGFQPILKKELNIFSAASEDVFGYQRPWYEYCQQYDTSHGAFRDTLSNFLMQRTFAEAPDLCKSFLTINPADLTNVFSVTKVGVNSLTDHIYGFVKFNMTAKLPINRIAIPRLD